MEIIYTLKHKITCTATIGIFDGIHLGHQVLIRELVSLAKRRNIYSLLISFWPLPQKVLGKKFLGCITTLQEKKKILASLGVDYFWILKTTPSLLNLDGEGFLKKIFRKVAIKILVVGEDFRFGKQASWGVRELKNFSRKFNFDLVVIDKQRRRTRVISSSLLRRLVRRGLFEEAEVILGRKYSLKGQPIKGSGRGRRLGYPTLNLEVDPSLVLPASGVYVVRVKIGKSFYLGAMNIGWRPTFERKKEKIHLEIHLLNFTQRKVAKNIEVFFLEKIREERRFSSPDILRENIKKDIDFILAKYSAHPSHPLQLIV